MTSGMEGKRTEMDHSLSNIDKVRLKKQTDVVIVGAGHAGCEASLACARLGLETVLFTISVESIAMMPCNPSIGGSSKGHLVREVDALGGEMGKNIDHTFLQSRMLNASKGPAVHSLRAQADKADYTSRMRSVLENTPHLSIRQSEVCELLTENGSICGVKIISGTIYECKACILCTGTYLNARCIYGEVSNYTGPNGLMAATHLTKSMEALGIRMRRFKTGTPARIDKRTIDFSVLEEQKGDEHVVPFSFETDPETVNISQMSCYLTYTTPKTHEIIRENLDRSPLFSGMIEGTGPRYCPSIEDKVVRFAQRDRHQVFLEPEGRNINEIYIGGMSSSLPEDVQEKMYRSVIGLENAHIVKNAYAIEYDCIDATQLKLSLEFKEISGLFSAGQINGSSGYEEAAAQGILAGINACRYVKGQPPLVLDRSEAYIGVLVDDLVTKETQEPYRMMTSRAEYRLILRQDNADLRLTQIGHQSGLIDDNRYNRFLKKKDQIEAEIQRVNNTNIGANAKVQDFLMKSGSTLLKTSVTLAELIRRPELDYEMLKEIDPDRPEVSKEVAEQVNISIKYEGYIRRQQQQVRQFLKMEEKKIDENICYDEIKNLRTEARQKLSKLRPENIGQASRISGVSPADISVLLIYLEGIKKGASEK